MLNLDLDKSINFLTSDNKQNFESGKPVEVKAIKSLREPNTYLFKTPGPGIPIYSYQTMVVEIIPLIKSKFTMILKRENFNTIPNFGV